VTDTATLSLKPFLAPRYWPNWLGVGLIWSLTRLPYTWQIGIGRLLGRAFRLAAKRRNNTVRINLALCFPEKSEAEREALLRRHYECLGIALMETAMSWWMPDRRLAPLAHIEGLEHLEQALEQGKGAILMGAHFTNLEIGARLLNMRVPFYVVYRHLDNPLLNEVMRRSREAHVKKAIHRSDIRSMLRSIRQGKAVWYAADQNYSGRNFVFAPFFGIPAATNSATARLARTSGAPVIPFFQIRLPGGAGYRLIVQPPLEDFPSGDIEADTLRINEVIEAQVRMAPEQYLWVHRRFKTRPPGEPDLYRRSAA
jgi:Kdo2-lipid IVA lauroyltransferase/acyltransferase